MSLVPVNIFSMQSFGCKLMRFSRMFPLLSNLAGITHRPHQTVPTYLLDRTVDPECILSKLTPDDVSRLQVIEAEHKLMLDRGLRVPSVLDAQSRLDLLCCTSMSGRSRYYEFAFKKEKRRENVELRKLERPIREFPDTPPTSNDRIVRVIDEKHIRSHKDAYVWAEMRCPDSAQHLVLDFSHESEMRLQDQKNLAAQMVYVMRENRNMLPHPFSMHLCSLKPGTNQYAFLEKEVLGPNLHGLKLTDMPWTISPNHYSVDFPLNDPHQPVIYLSPNAPRSFEPGEWDHNAVYVIGAIVDKCVHRPITFARARRANVKCIRLPLERYFKWSSGKSKTLTINCIHGIMSTAKATNGDWELALRTHLPKRLYESEDPRKTQAERLFANL